MITEISKQLVSVLKEIRDDKHFILGIASNVTSDKSRGKIIDFIEIAKSRGDAVTPDDIVALSVILGNEEKKIDAQHS